jgi:hypothetical protein
MRKRELLPIHTLQPKAHSTPVKVVPPVKVSKTKKSFSECETGVKVCSCGIQHIFTLYFYHNSDTYKYMIMYLLFII